MKILEFTNSLRIRSKLLIPICFVILVVVMSVSVYLVSKQNRSAEAAFRDNLQSIATSSRFMIHSLAEEHAKSHGLTFHRNSISELSGAGKTSDPGITALRRFESDPSLETIEEEYVVNGESMIAVHVPVRFQSECTYCHNKDGVDSFTDRKAGDLVASFGVSGSTQELRAQERQTLFGFIFGAIMVVALVSLIVQWVTSRLIMLPLKEAVMQLKLVARGDLRVVSTPVLSARAHSGDEVGELARSFSTMMVELRGIIRKVEDSALAVACSTGEISSTAEELAAAGQQQSIQAGEVASAVEEMTKTIIENSRNATMTSETAKKAQQIADEGGKAVQETVSGMRRIADVVNRSAETVKKLGKSSDDIGVIVGVIEDIADQTNLLALNAAIEAARAGDQGRGFATVADEVRKLAERTTKATKEIATMIQTIQEETTGAVTSMSEGTAQVGRGIELADRAGSSLHEIVNVIQGLADMIAQIAVASEEQSSSSEQISKNVEAISNVTNEAATGVQQVARATEDLNRLAEDLKGIVGRFKLDVDVQPGRRVPGNHPPVRADRGGPKRSVRTDGVLVPQ
jgi:methyl-accepting chemotaxis protein